ncbi:MAG TPA: hypothetical protein VIK33_17800 [Anaerolineae bacterium]
MRHVIRRVVKTVTTVTWTIRWDADVADRDTLAEQAPAHDPEPALPALPEGQSPPTTSDPITREETSEAIQITSNTSASGETPGRAIRPIHSSTQEGEKP